jgi:hypothetical protein
MTTWNPIQKASDEYKCQAVGQKKIIHFHVTAGGDIVITDTLTVVM